MDCGLDQAEPGEHIPTGVGKNAGTNIAAPEREQAEDYRLQANRHDRIDTFIGMADPEQCGLDHDREAVVPGKHRHLPLQVFHMRSNVNRSAGPRMRPTLERAVI